MTPDEAKQLLGGYATGSLTEAERKALFAAALEDQELFEELAGEQDLLEILALPGAKERLAAALESGAMTSKGAITTMSAPEEKKKKPAWWLFALAGVAGVGLLVFLTTKKSDTPVEVASTQSAQPAEIADSKSDDSKLKETSDANPALDALARSEREKGNNTQIEGQQGASAAKPRAKGSATSAASTGKAAKRTGATDEARAKLSAPVAAVAPAPPAQAKPVGNGFGPGAGGGAAAGFLPGAGDSAQARLEAQNGQQSNGQQGGKGGGKGGAKGNAFAATAARPDAPPVRAGNLTYVLTGRGSLKVTAAVSGSLEVTAADRHLIGWDPVVANSTVEMPVPSGVDSLTLRFAAPGQQAQVVQIPIRQ
jgi:hypothetical protein